MADSPLTVSVVPSTEEVGLGLNRKCVEGAVKAVEFEGQTAILAPPRHWDNGGDGAKVGGLPIQRIMEEYGVVMRPVLRSMWRPSKDELAQLNEGAHVCLAVLGDAHPPVCIYVEHAEELP